MTIFALGINHTTAPVSIREQLSFPEERLAPALHELVLLPHIDEAAILSTCNRTELYCGTQDNHHQSVINWISSHHNVDRKDFTPYLYSHFDNDSIRHMLRVACGLDSMILGEPQILGQMKTAYQTATAAGTIGKTLGKLFQHTFQAAKKVRTDTAIGSSPISVAFAAVRLANQIFDDLSEQTALLIGAGETIELTARHLYQHKIGQLIIANRTLEKAHTLASTFNGFSISLSELPSHLAEADILVSSTASQLPILGKGSVESAIRKRKRKPIFMVDLAVPRDIEPEVAQLPDIYLYTVDDLKNTIDENINSRKAAAKQAEEIIDTEVEHFLGWLRTQGTLSTIRDYREQAEAIKDQVLSKALASLSKGTSPEQVLNLLAHSLTNKLIHTPTTQIKQAGINEQHDMIALARELFQLDDPK